MNLSIFVMFFNDKKMRALHILAALNIFIPNSNCQMLIFPARVYGMLILYIT